MRTDGRGATLAVAGVVAGLATVAGLVAWQVREGQRLPERPVDVAWEQEACAHCHMHLSERRFAVQLQTPAGDVLNFDDPGCFFLYLAEEQPPIHEVWFHHSGEDRWLRRGEAGFVSAPATPMNLGLAAVTRDAPGAMSFDAARDYVLARRDREAEA